MNIFLLDTDPTICAQMHCDKHVVKMVLETAQLLCSAYEPGTAPYKRTHYNHPCAVWSRSSLCNYKYLIALGMALCGEYTHRYGKVHKSQQVIEWCSDNLPDVPTGDLTEMPQCMPDEFKDKDVVTAYRNYYEMKAETISPFRYTKRPVPGWLDNDKLTNISIK